MPRLTEAQLLARLSLLDRLTVQRRKVRRAQGRLPWPSLTRRTPGSRVTRAFRGRPGAASRPARFALC